MSAYSLENEAFKALLRYGSVVLLKLLAMSPITIVYRLKHGCVPSMEDAVVAAAGDKDKQKKMLMKNDEVDRVRSAHMNDLENIVPFFIISLLYVAIGPDPATAGLLFKMFAASRILHTVAYLGKIRQPARALCFAAGMGANTYMVFEIMKSVW